MALGPMDSDRGVRALATIFIKGGILVFVVVVVF